ncbi:MAG: aminotransferase class I/II-fold pyridoxal phosphate-dependent enzyme [Marinicellaceae bacterium]
MKIDNFKLERYFAQHEFSAKYLLSSSDCDGYEMDYVLQLADSTEKSRWKNLKLGYTQSQGDPLLRQAILQYYQTNSIDDVVVATPGELNFISMNVLLEPTDHIITVAPCYQSLYQVVKSIGSELSYWQPNSENWQYDTNEFEKLIQKNTKLLVLNFPHNPTGSYLRKKELEEIVRIARKHNITIFSDEMYHKLVIDDDYDELPPICDIYEKGISLWGTSKTFGLAGLRTGWLVSQDQEFLSQVVSYKDYLSICNSAPSEVLTLIALNHIDQFLQPNIKKINKNIALFEQFTKNHSVIKSFVAPKAGSTSFVELDIKSTSLDFSNELVKETGIMTVPAEMFEHPGKYIRVGFGRENFAEVLDYFDAYLSNKYG